MPTDRPYIFLTCDSKHTYIFFWPEWYICIKDKLKNVRRKSDEPSATCRKKLKMSDKILTSVARKRSFPSKLKYYKTSEGNGRCNK